LRTATRRVTKDRAWVTVNACLTSAFTHIISNMRPLLSLTLLVGTLSTLAGIPAQGSDSGRVPASSTLAVPHPKRVGGDVSAPTLIHVVNMPGLAHMDAGLVVNLWVDTDGVPSHIRVLQGGDSIQNEKIIAAVLQYRFKPAMQNGKPVLVEMNMQLDVD
jgi:hypothetical protein